MTDFRYGQLTYTTYAAAAGGGTVRSGWQVKQHTSEMSADEVKDLVGRVSTQLDPVAPTPRFPGPDDIAALPRRLVYVRTGPTSGAVIHTVPAGEDPRGRPGNVFAHAVLDRSVGACRPIELWRSRDWLVPYGQTEVAAAVLDPARPCPRPGGVVGRDRVLDFIRGDARRPRVLSLLLDAVHGCLSGGPRVVLAVPAVDEAALWIGAVSYFMGARRAGEFCWSTFERSTTVGSALDAGLHLAAIPLADAPSVPDGMRTLVVDVTAAHETGELGGTGHRTSQGTLIPVTEWSALAEAVLWDRCQEVLVHLDPLEALVDERTSVSWPLAMVVIGDPTRTDGVAEARVVLNRDTPVGADRVPVVRQALVRVLLPELGHSVDDAWGALPRLTAADSTETTREMAWEEFVKRALAAPQWLGLEHRPYPATTRRPEGAGPSSLDEPARIAIAGLAERASRTPPASEAAGLLAGDVLRTLELLAHAGLRTPWIDDQAAAILDRSLVGVLDDEQLGRWFVQRIGETDPEVHRAFVLSAMVPDQPRVDRSLGARMTDEVAAWLLQHDTPVTYPDLHGAMTVLSDSRCILTAERTFRALRCGTGGAGEWRASVPVALARALYERERGWPATDPAPLLRGVGWPVQWQRTITGRFPDFAFPVRVFADAVIRQPMSPVVERSAQIMGPGMDADDRLVATWAWLRTRDLRCVVGNTGRSGISSTEFHEVIDTNLAEVWDDYRTERSRPVSDLVPKLIVVLVLLRAARAERDADHPRLAELVPDKVHELAESFARQPDQIVDVLYQLVRSQVLTAGWVVATVVAIDRQSPLAQSSPDLLAYLRDSRGTVLDQLYWRLRGDPERCEVPITERGVQGYVRCYYKDERLAEFAPQWARRAQPMPSQDTGASR